MKQGLIFRTFLVNIWFALFSFLIPEVFLLVLGIVDKILSSFRLTEFHTELALFWNIILWGFVIFSVYKLFPLGAKIIKAGRWDLLVSLCIGSLIFIFRNKDAIWLFLSAIDPNVICFIFVTCLTIGILGTWFFEDHLFKKKNNKPFFLSDDPGKSQDLEHDVLGFKELAKNLANKILNNGSINNIVFGLDAPWGAGKTTFLEFVKSYWETEGKDQVITFDFKPSFFSNDNLLELFCKDLCAHINEKHYSPELQSLIQDYLKIIKGVSFGKVSFDLSPLSSSSAVKRLEEQLTYLGDKKIVVIIDDLDRLNLLEIKQILNLVKKVFSLPNITFILCYDTQNINSFEDRMIKTLHTVDLEGKEKSQANQTIEKSLYGDIVSVPTADNQKLAEYFEKIVNIKISLFPDPEKLRAFLLASLGEIGLGEEAVQAYAEKAFGYIFDPKNYHNYRPFLGDLRKIKRFINTLKLFGRFNIDFTIYDYNPKDLVHLMLIYIHYPQIFRKIFDTEGNGGKSFFSLVSPYDLDFMDRAISGQPKFYRNSESYRKYLKTLDKDQSFLVRGVFDVSTLEDSNFESVNPDIKRTRACFNGSLGSGRNLEINYLKLIVNGELPSLGNSFRVYENVVARINNLEDNGSFIEAIDWGRDNTEKDLFVLSKRGEVDYVNLFTVISEATRDKFGYRATQKTMDFIIENLPRFSFVTDDNIRLGLRDDFAYTLLRLLDRGGWKGGRGQFSNNSKENIVEISDRIFGDNKFGKYDGKGILETLSSEDRGIPGIFDLMLFRLFCSQDRGGSLYNVYNALAYHAGYETGVSGVLGELVINQMREISQMAFEVFNKRFIEAKVNFIEAVDAIPEDELFGETKNYFYDETELKPEEVSAKIERLRNRIISYVIYQLTNKEIKNGVGCGMYSVTGTDDDKEIRGEMNKYLFDLFIAGPKWFIRFLAIYIQVFTKENEEDEDRFYLSEDFWLIIEKSALKIYLEKMLPKIRKELENITIPFNTINGVITKEAIEKILKSELEEKLFQQENTESLPEE